MNNKTLETLVLRMPQEGAREGRERGEREREDIQEVI